MSNKTKLALVAGLALAVSSGFAQAATFSFSITSSGFNATGTGQADSNSTSDPFLLSSISGTFVSGIGTTNITGLVNGPSNTVSLTQPAFVTASGISFSTDNAGTLNIRFDGSSYILSSTQYGTQVAETVNFTRTDAVAVPGPLAGAGAFPVLALVGAAVLRRRRSQRAA